MHSQSMYFNANVSTVQQPELPTPGYATAHNPITQPNHTTQHEFTTISISMTATDRTYNRCILVTGGCGYIGTHTITCLLNADFSIVVVDNNSNSSPMSLDRVARICNLSTIERKSRLIFEKVDMCDEVEMRKVFENQKQRCGAAFAGCIHFAGLKVIIFMNRFIQFYFILA